MDTHFSGVAVRVYVPAHEDAEDGATVPDSPVRPGIVHLGGVSSLSQFQIIKCI